MQVFHLSVALPAGNLAVDMALMVEEHMFCYIIDFYPGCRCPGVEIAVFYLNPRVLGDDVVVTVEAFSHRRYSRVIGISYIGMAVLALYLFDPVVNIVAKRDRLFRTDTGCRSGIE